MEEDDSRTQDVGKETTPLTPEQAEDAVRKAIQSEFLETIGSTDWISEDVDTEELEAVVVDAASERVERVVADTLSALGVERARRVAIAVGEWEGEGWRERIEVAVEEAVADAMSYDGDDWKAATNAIMDASVPNLVMAATRSREGLQSQVKAMLDIMQIAAIHFRTKEIEALSKTAAEAAVAEVEQIAAGVVEDHVYTDDEEDEGDKDTLMEAAEEAAKEAKVKVEAAVQRTVAAFVAKAKATLARQEGQTDLSWVTEPMNAVLDAAEEAAKALDSAPSGEMDSSWTARILQSLQIDLVPGTASERQQQVGGPGEDVAVGETGLQNVQAYCLSCQDQTDVDDPRWVTLINGTHAIQGQCSLCGQRVTKFAKPPPGAVIPSQTTSRSDEQLSDSNGEPASTGGGSDPVIVGPQSAPESFYDFVQRLSAQKVRLQSSPMFSPKGKPLSLAGHVALAVGWQPSNRGVANRATGGRGPEKVLTDALSFTTDEIEEIRKLERSSERILYKLRNYCERHPWTRQKRIHNLAWFAWAARTRRSVRISYQDAGDAVTERIIDVYGVGNGYVDAYDHLRGTLRTFKSSRILQAQATEDVYTIPESYQPTDWVKKGQGELHHEVDQHDQSAGETSTPIRTTQPIATHPPFSSTGSSEPTRGAVPNLSQSQGTSRQTHKDESSQVGLILVILLIVGLLILLARSTN